MPKISWPTAIVVVVLSGAYVTLEVTHHTPPSWLAGISGALITSLFPQLFTKKEEDA